MLKANPDLECEIFKSVHELFHVNYDKCSDKLSVLCMSFNRSNSPKHKLHRALFTIKQLEKSLWQKKGLNLLDMQGESELVELEFKVYEEDG